MKARIWKDNWDMVAPWCTDIPPSWNPGKAYEFPNDSESAHIGIYGFTTWKTFTDALAAVNLALSERIN